MKVAAAILAGGRARRLGGVFKGGLDVGGRRILEREWAALTRVADEVLVVGGDEAMARALGAAFVIDRVPERGPLGGLDAAFRATRADALLVVGCDLPFLDERLLALVRDAAPDAEVVAPLAFGRPQALHARYARSLAPAIEARLARGELRLLDLVASARTHFLDEPALRAIDPTLRGLTNVNTPADLEAARKLA